MLWKVTPGTAYLGRHPPALTALEAAPAVLGPRATCSRPGGFSVSSSPAAGYTLVELLVVIAIIMIMAAMLFPVWELAAKSAEAASCLSHIRSIAFAAKMYCDDFDDRLLPARTSGGPPGYFGVGWGRILSAYMSNRSLLICPTDPNPTVAIGTFGIPRSYGINEDLCMVGGYDSSSLMISAIDNPARTIIFMDLDSTRRALGMSYKCHGLRRIASRHNEQANFAFCDGHAERLRPEETIQPENLWDRY